MLYTAICEICTALKYMRISKAIRVFKQSKSRFFLDFRIGVAEKGYITVELSVHTSGGHSSMPPPETSIGIMSKAVVK